LRRKPADPPKSLVSENLPLKPVTLPRLVGRFVDLRSGEGSVFVRSFGVLLLTIAAHTVLETARDALFLTKLAPRNLAFVYVATAIFTIAFTPLSVRLTRAAGAKNALVVSLLLTAFSAAYFRIRPPGAATVFSLYVFGALSATVLVGQFWQLAATLFTAAQSRRLFGPLASGGVLGGVGGGAIAALLLHVVPVGGLLGVAALLYFAAALLATQLNLEEIAVGPGGRIGSSPVASRAPLGPQLSTVRHDPFLIRLAFMAALSIALSVVVDYLYKAKVSRTIAPEDLGQFFARYQLVLSLGALVLQLAITGPVVQRIGVVGLALTGPLLLSAGATMTAVLGAPFWIVVLLKGTDTSLRNSLGRVAAELLWAPVEQQARARGFVDLIVTRVTQAAAGVALLAATMQREFRPGHLAAAAAALAVLWLTIGVGIRKPYIALFRQALSRGSQEREFMLAELDLTSVETLVEALARPQPSEVIAAMNVLAERKRERLIPALILLHGDEGVLLRALEILGPSRRRDWYSLGEKLLESPSEAVRQGALRAFALAGEVDVLDHVAAQGSPALRTFATLYLAQLGGHVMDGDPLSWDLFADDDQEHSLKLAFIESLAAHPTVDTPRLLLAFARLPALASAVTTALTDTADESCIDFLIGRLKLADDRLSARRALVRIGPPALSALSRALDDLSLDRRVRIHVPRSVSAFLSKEALALLLRVVVEHENGLVRYKALRGLEQIALETSLRIDAGPVFHEINRNALEYLRLFSAELALKSDRLASSKLETQLVVELLEDKVAQSRDRLARLLQVLHRGDDIPAIFAALTSRDRRRRGRAVEFLDALIRGLDRSSDEVAPILRLVVDDLPDELRAERAAELVGSFPDARGALTALAQDSDGIVSSLSTRALGALGSLPPPAPPLAVLTERPA
jgi:ATP:ADP antiporter, AAA family